MSSWTKTQPSQAAQFGIAADRFAHEIGAFLKVISGALTAAKCQAVRQQEYNGEEISTRANALMDRKMPKIVIEKISLERVRDYHEAIIESSQEWFAEGMIPKPDLSVDELEQLMKDFLGLWENDNMYLFNILDASINQVVGFVFLNHVSRLYQMANLGYQVRTSRMREGIATEAARLAARYGFEKLGFQRIEIVIRKDHIPSLKVAEKLGAVREGLLRNRLQLHGSAYDAFMYSLIPNDLGIHKTA